MIPNTFQKQLASFHQKACWDFDWDGVESEDQFGKNGYFNMEPSDPGAWDIPDLHSIVAPQSFTQDSTQGISAHR